MPELLHLGRHVQTVFGQRQNVTGLRIGKQRIFCDLCRITDQQRDGVQLAVIPERLIMCRNLDIRGVRPVQDLFYGSGGTCP